MDDRAVVVPDHVPEVFPSPIAGAATCSCARPVLEVRATWKGTGRTHCARCELPVPITFRNNR